MAGRRMIGREVLESDAYQELSFEAQALYPQICLNADDDGFLNSARRVCRTLVGGTEPLEELVDTGFLIRFDSGVFVVTDWFVQNYNKKDRYRETRFVEERNLVDIGPDKRYFLISNDLPGWNPSDSNLDPKRNQIGTEVESNWIRSIDKNSIDKVSLEEQSGEKENRGEYGEEETLFNLPPPNLTDQMKKNAAIQKLMESAPKDER